MISVGGTQSSFTRYDQAGIQLGLIWLLDKVMAGTRPGLRSPEMGELSVGIPLREFPTNTPNPVEF